jgi:membrane protein
VTTDPATRPATAPDGAGEPPRGRTTDRIVARVVQTKGRVDASRVGHVQRRFVQADLANQAMILAALALSLLLPVLVTLAALLPLGGSDSLPAAVGQRLGLNAGSTADLQRLFPKAEVVRGGTTVFGSLFTLLSAYAWPAALQRGYEIAWGVESKGWRGLWRPFAWLTGFVAAGALLIVLPTTGIANPWRTVLLLLFWTPVVFAGSWWTQHFLLRGAVGWRLLLPGAVAMTVGLIALRAFAAVYLSTAISVNYARYGPLGIVFMLLTWLIAVSTVMLGGPVVGAALVEHRRLRLAAAQPSGAPGADGGAEIPPPRPRDGELSVDRTDGG